MIQYNLQENKLGTNNWDFLLARDLRTTIEYASTSERVNYNDLDCTDIECK